ncbi:MAG: tetratricopeptide repeat protein [Candidatus Omnitrophota bacterium]
MINMFLSTLFFCMLLPVSVFAKGIEFKTTNSLFQILSPYQGSSPQNNCLYDLSGMIVLQSLKDGVLIEMDPTVYYDWAIHSKHPIVFLYTAEELVDGASLKGRWAYYVGPFKYLNTFGSQKTVYAFRIYNKKDASLLAESLINSENERNNENNPDFYYTRGITNLDKNNYDQTISDETRAINLDPKNANAFIVRGRAYYNKGNFDRAISDETSAIEIDPNNVSAYQGRAYAYFHKGNHTKAWADTHKIENLGYQPNPDFIEELKSASGMNQ